MSGRAGRRGLDDRCNSANINLHDGLLTTIVAAAASVFLIIARVSTMLLAAYCSSFSSFCRGIVIMMVDEKMEPDVARGMLKVRQTSCHLFLQPKVRNVYFD
jgi:hypothetical protein